LQRQKKEADWGKKEREGSEIGKIKKKKPAEKRVREAGMVKEK
jgi:hypothetical protein